MSRGQETAVSKVPLRDGLACEIEPYRNDAGRVS